MANSGPDSNGSQFFIVYRDSTLPPTYTVFGRVDDRGLAVGGATGLRRCTWRRYRRPTRRPITITALTVR